MFKARVALWAIASLTAEAALRFSKALFVCSISEQLRELCP